MRARREEYSPWSELNKERVRRLDKLGMMTDAGRAVLPPMGPRSFKIDPDIERALKDARAWSKFRSFPPLYQRVRAYNVAFYKKRDPEAYQMSLGHLVEETMKGRMFGQWNDYGRLLDYRKGGSLRGPLCSHLGNMSSSMASASLSTSLISIKE